MTKLLRRSPAPLYYQLESVLRDEIAAGSYPPAIPMPTEDALVRRFAVSRITVRRAMERLVYDGLIYRVPGRGTFVQRGGTRQFRIERNPADLMGFEEDIGRHRLIPETRVLRHEWVMAPVDVAEFLGLAAGTEVLRFNRLGTVQGHPLWVEEPVRRADHCRATAAA